MKYIITIDVEDGTVAGFTVDGPDWDKLTTGVSLETMDFDPGTGSRKKLCTLLDAVAWSVPLDS